MRIEITPLIAGEDRLERELGTCRIGLDPIWVLIPTDLYLLAKPKTWEKTRVEGILRMVGLEPVWVWGASHYWA